MTDTKWIGRRDALALGLAAGAATAVRPARAQQPSEVKIAMLVPMSGPWARQGILEQMGAELAIDDVNSAGGIKSLGGAKLKLVQYDTGDSAEKAKNAAQRMVAQEPDLVGGFGCWLSSFTLAATEVTERASLPWLTLSYSDLITGRGFRYVFQTSPTAPQQADDTVPIVMALAEKTTGKRPTKVGIIGDSTAAAVSFRKALDEHVLKDQKLSAVVNEVYTPPLSDATTLVQAVRSARPDFMLLLSTSVPDDKLLTEKFNEYGMGATKLPLVGNGGHWGTPELLKVTGADLLQGVMVGLANWPGKDQAALSKRFEERTKEPWFGHDSLFAYAHVMILKEALEKAGVAERQKVAEAIRKLDMTDGPALLFPGHHLQFDDKGRRKNAQMVMIQWQNGKPVTIYPTDIAAAPAIWKA
ncbi:MAG: ABC transporter substrate-binding protein [Alphaproteobacteria bacterium]|nr:ABC transporter substrate-binding protein [Alphaproteobacteria bacterium]